MKTVDMLDVVLEAAEGLPDEAALYGVVRLFKASKKKAPTGAKAEASEDTTPGDLGSTDPGWNATIVKAREESRYTLSVVYPASSPDAPWIDAHREWATADELQKAQWRYVQNGDRNIYAQHGMIPGIGMKKIGEWVDLVSWPKEEEFEFKLPTGEVQKASIPAGSVYMGVIWTPEVWPAIKAGRIRGYSFGGAARRITVDPNNRNILKAAMHTGAMVALYPPEDIAQRIAVNGGEDPSQLHVTLAFLGEAAQLDEQQIIEAVKKVAADYGPLSGEFSGVGRFSIPDGDAFYASLDMPTLPEFRQRVVAALKDAGAPVAENHGYSPHMTLKYVGPKEDNPIRRMSPIPVTFDHITVTMAGDLYEIPFAGVTKYDENQPRDDHGRWTDEGGSTSEGTQTARDVRETGQEIPIHGPYIRVKSADEAIRALQEGKYVELDPSQVGTFVHRLGEMSVLAQSMGLRAPAIDMCQVSVPDTNLFCEGNKGYARKDMPQLHDKEAFKEHLTSMGLSFKDTEMTASRLKSTQREIDGVKVGGMMTSAERGKFDLMGDRIFVSSDNFVLDGHHRWAAAVGLDYAQDNKGGDVAIPVTRVDLPITVLLELANKYADTVEGGHAAFGKRVARDAVSP